MNQTPPAAQPQPNRPGPHGPAAPFGPQPFGPQPFVHYQTGHPAYPMQPPRPPAPRPPAPSISERLAHAAETGLIGRVLAGVGVAVTLSGIVMLLVLAAQAGLLRPEVRVIGGGVLAAILVGLGLYIGRTPARRSGAVALVATGVAGLLFDVLATTAVYEWLPAPAGLAVAALVSGVGLGVAHRWDSRTLANMTSVAMLILAPVLTGGIDVVLVGFMLVYVAATVWIQVGRDWPELFAINTAGVLIPTALLGSFGDTQWVAAGAAVVGAVLALGSALLLARSHTRPELLSLISSATVIALVNSVSDLGVAASAVLIGAAALFTAAAFGSTKLLPRDARMVWLIAAGVLALAAVGYLGDTAYRPSVVMVFGLLLAGASLVVSEFRAEVRVAATVFTVLGIILLSFRGAWIQMFVVGRASDSQTALLIGCVAGLLATAALTWVWAQAHAPQSLEIVVGGSVIGLGLVTQACISAAYLFSTDAAAFRGGHTAATVIWCIAAATALVTARRSTGSHRGLLLIAGLAVMTASIAKLFLFDLAALNGVFRVIAFIVVGLVLLALGVTYAQSLAAPEKSETQQPVAA